MSKNDLIKQKQDLIRAYENKLMSEEQYVDGLAKVEVLIQAEIKKEIEEKNKALEQKEATIVEPKKKRDGTKMRGLRGFHKESVAKIIGDVLCNPNIITLDDTAKEVQKTTKEDIKKITIRIKAILRDVKNKKGHWTNYIWNADKFTLVKKDE